MKYKKIIKQYKIIIICLAVLSLVSLIYCFKIMNANKTYIFNGQGEYVNIYNGVIALNSDINLLEGSDIDYIYKKDFVVTEYKIGYYVKINETTIKPIFVINEKDEEGLSLKKILEGISTFNITELPNNHIYFTNEKIRKIDNGLYFIIEAKDNKGNIINEQLALNVSKVSK